MIRDIILMQQRELEQKLSEKYVVRGIPAMNMDSGMIHVIIGPRRAGKSMFGMHQLKDSQAYGYANFDDERLVKVQDFDEILGAIHSIYSDPRLLMLDEIQNFPHWELVANRLQRQGYKLILTGSNSNLLSSELSTHLTGRHLPCYVFPFSFSEYMTTFPGPMTQIEQKEKFNDFLMNGGYPEPLIHSLDYKGYLQVLFDAILFKDIVKRYRIRQPGLLGNLANYLISNMCGEFSLNSLSKAVQISSVHTLKKYLGFLEEVFLFFTLPRYSFKVSEQQKTERKIYCYDNGFFNAKAFHFSNDWGKLLENLIASELMKQTIVNGTRLFFWKSREGEEVDFVLQEGAQVTKLIQVGWDVSKLKAREREVRALLKASQQFKTASLILLTNDEEGEEKARWFGIEKDIRFIPAWKWLLANTG